MGEGGWKEGGGSIGGGGGRLDWGCGVRTVETGGVEGTGGSLERGLVVLELIGTVENKLRRLQ